MIRKITRTGSNLVVELPDIMLNALRLGEGTEISIELHQESDQIVLSPVKPDLSDIDIQFARQVAEFIQLYRPALEALAR